MACPAMLKRKNLNCLDGSALIQDYLRRVYMESYEHNRAYISLGMHQFTLAGSFSASGHFSYCPFWIANLIINQNSKLILMAGRVRKNKIKKENKTLMVNYICLIFRCYLLVLRT